MDAKTANELYLQNWNQEFTTMEALFERIKVLADNGAYSLCVYIDSQSQYQQVATELHHKGYVVEDYNGGNNGILEVNW